MPLLQELCELLQMHFLPARHGKSDALLYRGWRQNCLSKENQLGNMVNILEQYKLAVLMVPIIISETVLEDNMCVFVHSCIYVKLNDKFVLFSFFSRIIDQRFEKVSYFVFGDFNFRLDAKAVVEVGLLFYFCCRPY